MYRFTTPHFSTRGIPLVISVLGDQPLLTVEWASKWYTLQLLQPIEREKGLFQLEEVHYHEIQRWHDSKRRDINSFVDHVPNPEAVRLYAEDKEWILDEIAEELIVGRWQLEVVEPAYDEGKIIGHILQKPDGHLDTKFYYPHNKRMEPHAVEDLFDVPLSKASEESILAELKTRQKNKTLKGAWMLLGDGT